MTAAQRKEKKAAMLKALETNGCNVSAAALIVGIDAKTHRNWCKDDPEYKEGVEEATERTYDFVEGQIMKAIQNGNITMTIFFAKTKMKHRGYVETQEIVNSQGSLPPWLESGENDEG